MLMQNIVLKDAATPTPADHTFKPTTLVNQVGSFVDMAKTRVADWPVITGSFRPADASNVGQKARWKLTLPHTIVEDGGCCVDVNTPPSSFFTIEVVRNKVATNAQNEDLIKFLQELVKDPQFLATLRGEGLR